MPACRRSIFIGRFPPRWNWLIVGGLVGLTAPAAVAEEAQPALSELVAAEVVSSRNDPYVGESVDLTLRLWIKPFRDPRLGLVLRSSKTWLSVAVDHSTWGPFADKVKKQWGPPRQREASRPDAAGVDKTYYVYEIRHTIVPVRTGPLDLGSIAIQVNYPTRLQQRPTFVGYPLVSVAASRPLRVRAELPQIRVRPIPTAGRPPTFAGAVGHYEISATAEPTEVVAGDPLTLHLRIPGDGPLDTLPPPPLAELDDLTRDFLVSEGPWAGVIEDDAKTFSVSLRPRHAAVRTIPPIPLTSFDPQAEEFVTNWSEPIAVRVEPVDEMSLADIIPPGQDTATAPRFEIVRGPTVLHREGLPGVQWVIMAILSGPLLCGLVLFTQRLGRRLPATFIDRRMRRALRKARDAGDVAAALLWLVGRRIGTDGELLSADEAVQRLREQGQPQRAEELRGLLADAAALQYGPSAPDELPALVARATNWAARLPRRSTLSERAEDGG